MKNKSIRMKFSAALSAAVFAISGTAPAYASDQSGTVSQIAFAGGRFLFWVNGARTGTRPSCDCCSRWEITVNDANSQARVSMIMTAYAQGRPIAISGSGTCVAGSNDTEGINYMQAN